MTRDNLLQLAFRRVFLRAAPCLLVCVCALALGVSRAAAVGVLPPSNPASDCDRSNAVSGNWTVASIDACRASEGVGPLELPTNWSTLSPTQQGFVLIDLERVNRGIAPVIGLSASLSALAVQGADSGNDPPFPSSGDGGGIWAGASSVFAADTMWMYDDGPGGFDANGDCAASGSYCWMHRQIMLGSDGGGTLVAGGGFNGGGGDGSYAYLVMSHYSTAGLTFTWAHELRYFEDAPAAEPAHGTLAAHIAALGPEPLSSHAKRKVTKHHLRRRPRHHGKHHPGDKLTISFS